MGKYNEPRQLDSGLTRRTILLSVTVVRGFRFDGDAKTDRMKTVSLHMCAGILN